MFYGFRFQFVVVVFAFIFFYFFFSFLFFYFGASSFVGVGSARTPFPFVASLATFVRGQCFHFSLSLSSFLRKKNAIKKETNSLHLIGCLLGVPVGRLRVFPFLFSSLFRFLGSFFFCFISVSFSFSFFFVGSERYRLGVSIDRHRYRVLLVRRKAN